MIIVELAGGLGNQMFQYATGRRLALRHGVDLAFDLSWFERYSERKFELPLLRIEARTASARECRTLRRWKRSLPDRALSKLTGRPDLLEPSGYFAERSFRFDPAVLSLPDPCYLHGYWQSPRYFEDVAELIRRELTPVSPPGDGAQRLEDRIRAVHAVSLHVRRGDYVTGSVASQVHGTCTLDYYERAVRALTERVAKPVFFVFTDDPAWTKAHLTLPFESFHVGDYGTSAIEELRLMSLCRSHVIANSTFSWWGAWLDDAGTFVVAPERWFEAGDHDHRDLIPSDWLQV